MNGNFYVLPNDPTSAEPRAYRNYYRQFMQSLGLPYLDIVNTRILERKMRLDIFHDLPLMRTAQNIYGMFVAFGRKLYVYPAIFSRLVLDTETRPRFQNDQNLLDDFLA